MQRLKVPPSINQFSKTIDKNQATELLKVLMKYQPEDKKAKQQRLKEIAAAKEAGKEPAPSKAPKVRHRRLSVAQLLVGGRASCVYAFLQCVRGSGGNVQLR